MSTGAGALFGNQNQMVNVGPFSSGGFGGSPPTAGGSNQWMSYPGLPNFNPGSPSTNPFGMSTSSTGSFTNPGYTPVTNPGIGTPEFPGSGAKQGGGFYQNPTFDPTFTGSFYSMIQQLLGGAGGGLQNNLLSFLGGGPTSIPGASSLSDMASTGDPISALPEWQAMLNAQQQNIQQNQANLKEQFGFAGDLQSSPFGTAMSNYMQQTSKDQNALLAQLEQQSMESAMQRKLSASQDLTGMAGAETQFLDQLFSQGALAQPGLHQKPNSSILGGLGSLLGMGGAAGGSIIEGLSGGGGAADVLSSLAGMFV